LHVQQARKKTLSLRGKRSFGSAFFILENIVKKQIEELRDDIRRFEMKIKKAPKEVRNEYKLWVRKKRSQLKQLEASLDR
jgi:hypothetical protein